MVEPPCYLQTCAFQGYKARRKPLEARSGRLESVSQIQNNIRLWCQIWSEQFQRKGATAQGDAMRLDDQRSLATR